MANWSELPKELIYSISEFLESPLYLVRFRSVCSSWRTNSTRMLKHHHFPDKFPIVSTNDIIDGYNTTTTYFLSKHALLLMTPPPGYNTSWLIRTSQDPLGRTQVWHGFSRAQLKPSVLKPNQHGYIPRGLDPYKLPILDLGHHFVLSSVGPNPIELDVGNVAFMWLDSEKHDFVLLTIHMGADLALLRSGDEDWRMDFQGDKKYYFNHVCVFKGRLYAVDMFGELVVVGLDLSLDTVVGRVRRRCCGDKKYLVECDGELLLVDMYFDPPRDCPDEYDPYLRTINVYRLEENKWLTVRSLGNWVLILGIDCNFSISNSDLGLPRGNCVIFRDGGTDIDDLSGMKVFSLDEGKIDDVNYSNLLWPCPSWVARYID